MRISWITHSPRAFAAKLTALVALLIVLGGCQHPQQPVTITVLDPEWSQPDEQPAADQVSREFTQKTGIHLRHLPIPETSLAQLDLLRDLLREGAAGPDAVGIDVIWPGMLADHLVDLRPYLAKELSSEAPQLVAGFTVDGKVVAVPYHAHIGVLEYRTDLLREYGYSRPPRTWDELEQMAARIQAGERAKGNNNFWGYVWQGAAAEGLTCNALEWQVAEGGGHIIEKDKTVSVDNPAAIRSWQRAARWIGRISPPGVVAYRELDSMNVWNAGEAAFRRSWQWYGHLANWREPGMVGKTGFASLPGGPKGRVGTLGGIGFGVSRFSRHQREALSFIRFLMERDRQVRADRTQNQPTFPLELHDLPRILDPYANNAGPDTQTGGIVIRPSGVSGQDYEKVSTAYMNAVHSVLVGKKKAPEAAAALEKELVAITGFRTGPPQAGE